MEPSKEDVERIIDFGRAAVTLVLNQVLEHTVDLDNRKKNLDADKKRIEENVTSAEQRVAEEKAKIKAESDKLAAAKRLHDDTQKKLNDAKKVCIQQLCLAIVYNTSPLLTYCIGCSGCEASTAESGHICKGMPPQD